MRGLAVVLGLAAVIASGCSEPSPQSGPIGYAPQDAPERATLPAKCKQALSFDDECRALFDRIWGAGAGANEAAALNLRRAYGSGNAYKKSDVPPAPPLGTKD
jgi:hypothetical protein